MNWAEFFHMGGYAWYVWPSWGLTTLTLLAIFIAAKRDNAKIRKDIARQISRENRHQENQPKSDLTP